MVVRNTTVVVELGGRRLVIDPCFSAGLGAAGVWQAPAPAVEPERLGVVDGVLVTCGAPGGFDDEGFERLGADGAPVLVPDEQTARRARRVGRSRRVRVVRAGDVVRLGPLVVTVSPARAASPVAVGYHVGRADAAAVDDDDGAGAGGALWHTGPLPPLDVAVEASGFATDHRAEVVLGAGPALGWRAGGPPFVAPPEDVVLLARRARARAVVPLGADVDVAPAFAWLVGRRAAAAPTAASALPGGPRLVDVAPGTWLRIATAGRGTPG